MGVYQGRICSGETKTKSKRSPGRSNVARVSRFSTLRGYDRRNLGGRSAGSWEMISLLAIWRSTLWATQARNEGGASLAGHQRSNKSPDWRLRNFVSWPRVSYCCSRRRTSFGAAGRTPPPIKSVSPSPETRLCRIKSQCPKRGVTASGRAANGRPRRLGLGLATGGKLRVIKSNRRCSSRKLNRQTVDRRWMMKQRSSE